MLALRTAAPSLSATPELCDWLVIRSPFGRPHAGEAFRSLYRPGDLSASARRAGAGDAPCTAASISGFAPRRFSIGAL
jgi:hypothetical protein